VFKKNGGVAFENEKNPVIVYVWNIDIKKFGD